MSKILNTLFFCILGITQFGNVHGQTNDELKALRDSLLEINAILMKLLLLFRM